MKILENKLESLKLQENQPVDGLEYEIVENHPAEEDQAGNNSPEIDATIYSGSSSGVTANSVNGSVSEVVVNGVSRSVARVEANAVIANDVGGSAAHGMTNGASGCVSEVGVNGISSHQNNIMDVDILFGRMI
ncbi:hypothetical protein Tco_0270058 [Tanacetum coccineum]